MAEDIGFYINKRQTGKTRRAINAMYDGNSRPIKSRLMVVHSQAEVRRLEVENPKLIGQFMTLATAQTHLRGMRGLEFVIDNLDILLLSMLGMNAGNIALVTATGDLLKDEHEADRERKHLKTLAEAVIQEPTDNG